MASQLEGVADALAKLRGLGELAQAKAIRPAVRAAAKPIMDEMQARVPVGDEPHKTYVGAVRAPGFLKRSLRFIVTRIPQRGAIAAVFGARKEAFYGPSFVEGGTKKMAAEPFMVPALEAAQERSVKAFVDTLLKKAQKILRKAGA